MATARFSILPIEAARLGLPFYDLFIAGWGEESVGIQYPVLAADVRLPSPYGIAIHPQSDIDRVIVQTNLGSGSTSSAVSRTAAINVLSTSVSVQAPLIVSPPSIMTPTKAGVPAATLVLKAHPDAIYHPTYAKSGTSALTAFTAAVVPLSGEAPAFVTPILGLRFYLKSPPIQQNRTNGYLPLNRNGLGGGGPQYNPVAVNAAGAPGEQLFAIIPVHGRSCVMVSLRATGCTPTVRVAINDFMQFPPVNPPVAGNGIVQLERTVFTSGVLTDNVPVQVPVAPFGDWLMLYYTPSDGDDGLLMWTTRASD